MNNTKRILFISEFAGFIGGTEKYIFSVAELLKAKGFVCDMIYKTKTNAFEKFKSVFDNCVDAENSSKLTTLHYQIKTMHRTEDFAFLNFALEKFSPTLFVHDHTYVCPKGYKYFPYKRKNCSLKYSNVRCGLCSIAVPPRHFTNGFLNALERSFSAMPKLFDVMTKFPSYVVLSDFMRDELVKNGIDKNKISLISPFVDIQETQNQPSYSKLKILFAGQHVASKGIHLLFESLTKMKNDFALDVLGKGARTPIYKALATQMHLEGKIKFHGFVENPQAFYQKADVVVFPSMWQEPFGLVGIEAMANSKPVVAFDVGGIRQWLEDGKNGILVPERNTTDFANALDTLASDIQTRRQLGNYAKNFVEKYFTKEKFLESFLKIK